MRRLGFTMIELVFAIIVMGIIGKFGVEFLAQSYRSFIFSSVNNSLQANSALAVESIVAKLQFRIKDSVIGRKSTDFNSFEAPASIIANRSDYNILEWVGSDIDGFRGTSTPLWSGIIDVIPSRNIAGSATLISPETNTTALNTLIGILSHSSGTSIDNAALYFIGSDSNIKTGYGWDGNTTGIIDQDAVMHPIKRDIANADRFISDAGNFTGVDVYEYYQLAWTAYAVGIKNYDRYDAGTNPNGTNTGDLTLWYDYQPWEGERYDDNSTKSVILMKDVSTFQYTAIGSIIKIQVCVNSDLVEDYSICKEKTVF